MAAQHTLQSEVSRASHRAVEQQILNAVSSLQYGTVEITVHDSNIVQIERKEKIRIAPARRS